MATDIGKKLGMTTTTLIMGHKWPQRQILQYTSIAYVSRLKEARIAISMSRKGNPYDNAKAESFMKTLKYEEVYLKEYQTYQEAADNIGEFIEKIYNSKRLHSGIGYLRPVEFEVALAA